MNQPTLRIGEPTMFITVAGAAFLLGVSRASVTRMIADGRLKGYRPLGARGERRPTLLSTDEVNELLTARLRAGVAGRAPVDPCAGGCSDPAAHAEGGHDV